MGVMTCGRDSCDGIMCERYSSTYGYICKECFEELVWRGAGQAIGKGDIKRFLDSPINRRLQAMSAAYFDGVFPFQFTEDRPDANPST